MPKNIQLEHLPATPSNVNIRCIVIYRFISILYCLEKRMKPIEKGHLVVFFFCRLFSLDMQFNIDECTVHHPHWVPIQL